MKGAVLRCVRQPEPRWPAVWELRCRCGSVYAEGPSAEVVGERILERHRQLMPLCKHRGFGVEVA